MTDRMNGDSDRSPGRRGPGAECRAFLRRWLPEQVPANGELQHPHLQECAFCSERMAARRTLGKAIAVRPEVPAALASRDLLERIHEAVVGDAEASEFGRTVAASIQVESLEGSAVGWPEAFLEGGVLDSALESGLREFGVGVRVARQVAVAPASPGDVAWHAVRESILDQVKADSAASRRHWLRRSLGHFSLGAAGAAAAAILLLMLLREGTPKPPEIVFTDLASAPNVDFAILRYGAPR